ncbi:MAG: hypothetical protein ABWY54_00585 [Glaciihabitans sp.]
MSTLALLGVADENTAHDGFTQLLHLHSVALLTLSGCAVVTTDATGSTAVIETPPEQVGVEHVDVSPAFPAILDALTAGTPEAISVFPDDAAETVRHILRLGRSAVVYLADDIAEGEVRRQLEFLNSEQFSLTITPGDIEALTPTK